MITDTAILRNIERQPKQSAGLKQLIRELGVHGHERRELTARLLELVRRGALVESMRDRYSLPRGSGGKNVVTGLLHMHRDGYGFVTPEDGPAKSRVAGDVFINPQAIGNAMHGDRVTVELTAVRADGKGEGRILGVAGRAHPTVVGTFHYGSRHNYVVPIDEKVRQDVIIPRGMEVPRPAGTEELGGTTRHRVLGEEATRRKPVEGESLEGVVVDVEITDWPTPTESPRGRVVEVLGHEDDFGVDVEIIIRKYHLSHRFPPEVLEEAQEVSPTITASDLAGRRDFRSLPIVTIDGESARDFDDAVYVERLENGNYQLQVHIADVARYVTESSALDEEARLRGNSVYFPDRAVPMLPVELSTDICSLRPQSDRLVLSCLIEIDAQGEVLRYEICEGVIRSAERMTYTDVNAILEGEEAQRRRYAPLVDNFLLMRDLAKLLNRKRERRGAIDFDLPEPEIEFDEFGLMKAITRSERNFAHRLIEEFMLTANESVAGYLEAKGVASLYRIHDKPEPRRVLEFEQVAAAFGYSLGVGPIPIRKFSYTDDRRPRRRDGRGDHGGQQRRDIEIPEDIHITPRMYQKLTKKIAGTAEERILSYLMLRSLKQARYSEENVGHFALAAPVYTHFTSPIRRYPDLIVHRILKQVLRASAEDTEYTAAGEVPIGRGAPAGSETPSPWSKRGVAENPSKARRSAKKTDGRAQLSRHSASAGLAHGQPAGNRGRGTGNAGMEVIPLAELHDIAVESSQAERRAADAERELLEWKKAKFMADHVGEDFDGLITSVTKFGFFVELTDMFIEGLVPMDSLTDDHYVYHDSTRQITGHRNRKTYALGGRVRVLVDRIDPVQRKIQFALFQEKEKPPQREKPKKSRRPKNSCE
jgi:ribonuclease R